MVMPASSTFARCQTTQKWLTELLCCSDDTSGTIDRDEFVVFAQASAAENVSKVCKVCLSLRLIIKVNH